MKILWISRHEMTADQREALSGMEATEVIHLDNVTLPSLGKKAVAALLELAREHNADAIAAVLPAHVAAAWVMEYPLVKLYLPVSVPAAAKEGEVRGGGFTFSHWECF